MDKNKQLLLKNFQVDEETAQKFEKFILKIKKNSNESDDEDAIYKETKTEIKKVKPNRPKPKLDFINENKSKNESKINEESNELNEKESNNEVKDTNEKNEEEEVEKKENNNYINETDFIEENENIEISEEVEKKEEIIIEEEKNKNEEKKKNVDETLDQRSKIYEEIIKNESSYINLLKMVDEVYITKLQQSKILKEETMNIIFSNILEILNLNTKFLERIKSLFKNKIAFFKNDQKLIGLI
jgi:hypothetical protein